jgi:hypothetical protein
VFTRHTLRYPTTLRYQRDTGQRAVLPADRIRPSNIAIMQARSVVKHIGIGSGEMLRGKGKAAMVTSVWRERIAR